MDLGVSFLGAHRHIHARTYIYDIGMVAHGRASKSLVWSAAAGGRRATHTLVYDGRSPVYKEIKDGDSSYTDILEVVSLCWGSCWMDCSSS